MSGRRKQQLSLCGPPAARWLRCSHVISTILVASPTGVSANGSFSYTGPAKHLSNGTLAGSARIKLSGKFVSSAKVTGTASFSNAKQSGCPGKAFTATAPREGLIDRARMT
jgi:hypothetical protein